ncbi:MAG: outer membrane lipoprotein-sorting protein [Deltaproteobacteria bacterium]|nr:outer membrane lipoprotein-sorting protein [Deltaproteobacteria bacterium]
MKKFLTVVFVMLLSGIVFCSKPVLAEMTPKEILEKSDEARGSVKGIEWEIKLESIENGRKQSRTLKIKARDFNSLAEFISPPKVKGRKLLMIDRNMWFIKPGLRKPVPISPRQKLMGSASNGDIASTNYAGDYDATLVSEDTVKGELCYLLDLTAINKKVTYDRIKYWVSKKRLVGVKAEFFTVSGKIFKSATFEYGNSIPIEGKPKPFVSKMIITDAVIKENVTTMTYSKIRLKKIPDSTFNLNLLVR